MEIIIVRTMIDNISHAYRVTLQVENSLKEGTTNKFEYENLEQASASK